DAETLFRAELAVDPGNLKALHGLGKVEFDRGRIEDANQLLLRAHDADPADAVVLKDRAVTFHRLRKFELAAWYYRLAVERAPQLPSPRVNWGDALLALGRYAEALPVFAAARSRAPADAAARAGLI